MSIADIDTSKTEPVCTRQCLATHSACVGGINLAATATFMQCKQNLAACVSTCPPRS